MRGVAILAVLLFLVVPPAVANAPVKDPRVPALQAQLKLLQSEVSALQAQRQQDRDTFTCEYALNRDLGGATLHALGLVSAATLGTALPPDLTRFDDQGSCQRIGVTR